MERNQARRRVRLAVRSALPVLALAIALAWSGSACVTVAQDRSDDTPAPNLVVILLDDLGYGDLAGFHPQSKIETPRMDRLGREGMRFTDAHAPGPLCHLSRYGLMTGRLPFRANVGAWRERPSIADDRLTLPQLLHDAGYHTAMVGKWHLGFHERGYDQPLRGGPVDRGFDSFFGIRASTDIPPYFYIRDDRAVTAPTESIDANNTEGWSNIQGEFWRAGGIAPDLQLADVLPRFTLEAETVIQDHARDRSGQPLFLYLAYPAPHTPWLPSPEFAETSAVPLYGDFVEMVDHEVGKVLDSLAANDLHDNTIVILTSDNGPVWYNEDAERFGHDSSGDWRGMKSDAWEAGHRMPFIVRWPERIEPESISHQTICFTDVMATMASILEIDLPPDAAPDSVDISRALFGTIDADESLRESLVIRSGGGMMTIRWGPWKLIDGLGSGGFSRPRRIEPAEGGPRGQLYHLTDDPTESINLYNDHPDLVERLKREMEAIVNDDR